MKRILVLLLLIPVAGLADDPFACVSPEAIAAFLPGYPEPSEYSTTVPQGFVEHTAPPSSRLVGSQVGRNHATVVYVVEDDIRNAADEIANSMIEQGWLDVSAQDDSRQGGFQSTYIPDHRQLCHDDGPKAVSIATRESRTLQLVSVSLHSAAGTQSCSAQRDRSRYRYNRVGLHRELPVLSLPDGVRSYGQGSGGGGDEYDSHVTVVTEMSKAGLMAVLNDQIRDQGWIFDASWSGSHSVGSTWAKESADGKPLIGLLTAYGGNEEAYTLLFEIRLDNAVARSGGPRLGVQLR